MKRLFELGNVVTTPTIVEILENHEILELINRHSIGDFGQLVKDDILMNVKAIKNGERILSCYHVKNEKIYIISEWDRSYTTVLLANEY